MKIDAKVVKTLDSGNVKAICDVTLDNIFVIHGVKLISCEKGTFVSMPSDPWNKKNGNKPNDIVHPLDAETRQQVFQAVSSAYNSHLQSLESELPLGVK